MGWGNSDPGDEDDGEQKLLYHNRHQGRLQPYSTTPLTILSMGYTYAFGRMEVRHPDHDLGDEDRKWAGWVQDRRKWQYQTRTNPTRPCK